MKKFFLYLTLVTCVSLVVVGCGKKEEAKEGETVSEGVIKTIEEDRVLVELTLVEGIEAEEGEDFGDMVFTFEDKKDKQLKKIEEGDKVRVVHSMATTRSMPPMSPARIIEKMK